MTKIGVLYGMEDSFPPALVDRINAMGVDGVTAEHLKTGGVEMAEPCGYDVIVDRISHDIPFYRSYLKNAVLTGTKVINNPFWWSADDKFFNYALAAQAGRRGSAHGAAAAQEASRRAPPTVHAQPGVSARLGRHLRLRRLSGVPQAARWRRLEERLQGGFARGVLRGLRRERRSLHDAAGGSEISGIFPLLRGRPARRCTSCATIRRSRTICAMCRAIRRPRRHWTSAS